MNIVYLLTGGNMGDRKDNLKLAQFSIEQSVGIIVERSHIYETGAWGITDQQSFLNQVFKVSTSFTAQQVLQILLDIELKLGRQRLVKYGPRLIDIDILFYNSDIINEPNLTIPHPELQNRRFVLTPLNEIAPDLLHPQLRKTISQLLQQCEDPLPVTLFS